MKPDRFQGQAHPLLQRMPRSIGDCDASAQYGYDGAYGHLTEDAPLNRGLRLS